MPSISAALVPYIPAGTLLDQLVTNSSVAVRWLLPTDVCYYETLNRPIADMALRQLIIAKAVDRLNENIGYLSGFPFLIQPQITNGSLVANVPINIFYDFNVSLSDKWSNVRLARVDRIGGINNSAGTGDTGTLRFIFTGNERTDGSDSTTETALFYVDYEIDSTLAWQISRPTAATIDTGLTGFSALLDSSEEATIGGTVVMNTVSTTSADIADFLNVAAPDPGTSTGTNSYWVVSTTGTDDSSDWTRTSVPHGTGVLTSNAINHVVNLGSDPLNWVESFNYPFDQNATRMAADSSITIPSGLFVEFDITAPAGDNPTSDTSGLYFPVWISKATRDSSNITFTFSTYNVTDTNPSVADPIEFATLTLDQTMASGQIVSIEPYTDLQLGDGSVAELALFTQHLGRGHVVLSSKWGVTGGSVSDFFDSLPEITSGTNSTTFNQAATRLSSYGISRIPKYVPTKGQSQALKGTSARWTDPSYPSDTNRFVTEADEGLGPQIDLEAVSGITAHASIERYGYTGTRISKTVKLIVDPSLTDQTSDFYATQILPRLTVLLGREPAFGDRWYNGIRFLTFNNDSWVG